MNKLNGGDINGIILSVRANKPDVQRAAVEKDHRYQAVLIAVDIENVPVIANKINAIEAATHIGQALPISSFTLEVPLIQRSTNRRVGFCKIAQRSL